MKALRICSQVYTQRNRLTSSCNLCGAELGEWCRPTALIAAVRTHAMTNYEVGGWDYVVECWSDKDIAEAIGDKTTEKAAIAAVKKIVNTLDEVRTDIRNA